MANGVFASKSQAIAGFYILMEDIKQGIASFNGRGDVTVWLKKIKLVAKLRGITDLHALIPLFLDGAAFALYEELPVASKDDAGKIEAALLTAFAMNKFQAYEALQRRRWKGESETVDEYLSDLRKLARLAGIKDEEMIRCAFVVGFPAEISAQLRSSQRALSCGVEELLERARMLIVQVEPDVTCAAAGVEVWRGRSRPEQRRMECYVCEGPHMAKWCPNRGQSSNGRRTCFKCGAVGHLARTCGQGNGEGKSSAPTPSQ